MGRVPDETRNVKKGNTYEVPKTIRVIQCTSSGRSAKVNAVPFSFRHNGDSALLLQCETKPMSPALLNGVDSGQKHSPS